MTRSPRIRRILLPALALLLLAACSTRNPYALPGVPHRGEDGFHNTGQDPQPSLSGLLKWLIVQPFKPAVGHDVSQVPRVPPDPARLAQPDSAGQATWLGHASVLLQMQGRNLVTDPMFSTRASPLSWLGPARRTPPALTPANLPHIDVVLISHDHYDHLDLPSLRALASQAGGSPLFVVPLGNGGLLREAGISRIHEMDWWQTLTLPAAPGAQPVQLTAVPVQHWSSRNPLRARNQRLWSGYVIADGTRKALFAGDTGYSDDFREIARRLGGIDFAMLPIGAYEPRDFLHPQHISPEEAVRIHRELGAKLSLGIHWGTFVLSAEAIQQPGIALAAARTQQGLAEPEFPRWAIGETRRLP